MSLPSGTRLGPYEVFGSLGAGGGNVGISGFASAPQYAITRDGRFILNVVVDGAVLSPITLVLNWPATPRQ